MISHQGGCFRGLQKTTLIDYPGSVACVFFVGGCSFRCKYCYNCSLVNQEEPEVYWEQVWSFLEKRKNVLDGVCVSGGEPCLAPFLSDFLAEVKERGFKTKLDTNGYHPDVLRSVLEEGVVDYVAMDVKNSPAKYAHTTGLPQLDITRIVESMELIRESGVNYEFRTTISAELMSPRDIGELAEFAGGGKRIALQPVQVALPTLSGQRFTPPPPDVLREMAHILEGHFDNVWVRGR